MNDLCMWLRNASGLTQGPSISCYSAFTVHFYFNMAACIYRPTKQQSREVQYILFLHVLNASETVGAAASYKAARLCQTCRGDKHRPQ